MFDLSSISVSHSHDQRADAKDSHEAVANLLAAIVLGIGRFIEGLFRFMFSILSSLAR